MDADVGGAADDYAGCDTLLNLGFCYNADNTDDSYGNQPPALGIMILQGPVIAGGDQDSAYFNDRWMRGYKKIPMWGMILFLRLFRRI